MLKKIVLSLVMVSGLAYSFDDQQREILDAIRKNQQAVDAPESQAVADAIGAVVEKGRALISTGVDAVKGAVVNEPINPKNNAGDVTLVSADFPSAPIEPELLVTPDTGALLLTPTDLTPESQVRFAAIRNAWTSFVGSNSVQFACDMFNPYAHGRAWKAMWQAGIKGALPILWADHKAVIAGAAVLTTAAAYYAHKKGWLAKAKTWATGLKEQYFVVA